MDNFAQCFTNFARMETAVSPLVARRIYKYVYDGVMDELTDMPIDDDMPYRMSEGWTYTPSAEESWGNAVLDEDGDVDLDNF